MAYGIIQSQGWGKQPTKEREALNNDVQWARAGHHDAAGSGWQQKVLSDAVQKRGWNGWQIQHAAVQVLARPVQQL